MPTIFQPDPLAENDQELRGSYFLLRKIRSEVPKSVFKGLKNNHIDMMIDDQISSLERVIKSNWEILTKEPKNREKQPTYGDLMPVAEWIACVESGGFIDYDGHGSLSTETECTNLTISPSDITLIKLKPPAWATHVRWFNR